MLRNYRSRRRLEEDADVVVDGDHFVDKRLDIDENRLQFFFEFRVHLSQKGFGGVEHGRHLVGATHGSGLDGRH